ncbi:3-hydroxyisobutyryl-CoA hydrolase, mitochondrial isoform X2 [Orussus abietinus]|nr:3-hydroxyisobutyryl-CoA hydrolase, mitochondrial isoform X2 [Orussus abietinus]
MNEDDVLFKDYKKAGLIQLNRPKALNTLNLSMVKKIYSTLKQWESSKELIVIKGIGEKAFCAGGDVKSIALALKDPVEAPVQVQFFQHEYTLNHLIATYKKPYVALISGITMGGGVGLSVHGKYRVATERTLFAMPETAIGLFPDVGATYVLPKLKDNLGIFLGLTGHRLKGIDVLHSGIATHYISFEKIEDLTNDLLTVQTDIDKIIKKHQPNNVINSEFSLAPYLKQINHCFSAPNIEEIISRLEADGSEWARNTIETLNKMSPTSLKVTKKALELGKQQTLAECLKMEFRLVCSILRPDTDFYEGVRAVLIDKDHKPTWNPKSLREVKDEDVIKKFNLMPLERELKL